MAADNSFSLAVDAWIQKSKEITNKVIRKVAFDMSNGIIQKTPVKTGRARMNWALGIGTPNTQTTDSVDPGGSAAANLILSGLADYDYESGNPIFITNSLPYIVPLENGHSTQAPNGMVKITVAEFQNYVEGAGKSA